MKPTSPQAMECYHEQLDNTVVVAVGVRSCGSSAGAAMEFACPDPDFVAFPTELSYRTVTRVNVRTSQRAWSWGAARVLKGMSVWPMTIVTSFDVAVPPIRRVELDRPWQWLDRGLAGSDPRAAAQREPGPGVRL